MPLRHRTCFERDQSRRPGVGHGVVLESQAVGMIAGLPDGSPMAGSPGSPVGVTAHPFPHGFAFPYTP
jgi:hypothetical protein